MARLSTATAPDVLLAQSASVTATGVIGSDFTTDAYTTLVVDVVVSTPSGTTPSMTLVLERLDAFGHWINVWTSAAITAAGTTTVLVGPYPAASGIVTALLTGSARLRCSAISGAGATFPLTASIIGR